MSDPAKSAEIEDVLSSIRRLVSEYQPGPDGSARPAEDTAGGAQKLVLTPALRVLEPEDPWAPIGKATDADGPEAAEAAAQDAAEGMDDTQTRNWAPDDRLANWDAEALERADDLADPSSDDAPTQPEEAPEPQAEAEPEPEDAQDAAAHAEQAAIENDAAAYEPAQETAPEEAEPQTAEPQTAEPEEAEVAEAPVETHEPVEADEPHDADDAETPVFARSMRMDQRVSELGARLDQPQGDDALEDVEDLGSAGLFSFPDSDDSVLDEDALRELIAQVVREELQGALGQKITRNVRKMVRREIRIALAAEELQNQS